MDQVWVTGKVSLIDWRGVSRDAEHYGKAHNAVTSCFARQTGSASIFLPVID